MQVAELFAPPAEVAAHPAVRAAHEISTELLAQHAAAADDPAVGVRREHLDALVRAGLAAVTVPPDEGGLGGSRAVDTEVVELLSAACGATWFVLAQHRLPQLLARAPLGGLDPATATVGPAAENTELLDGRRLAGVALAHLRRAGTPVTAEPDGHGGHHLTGRVSWCSGWGLLDALLVAGVGADGRVVLGLIDPYGRPGLRPSDPLPLSVFGGTRTVTLELDRCPLAADEVLLTIDVPAWSDVDRARTANATPDSLGLLRGALVELERLGTGWGRPEAVDTALALAGQALPLRAEAYALRAEPAQQHLERRTELRGRLAELTVRSAAALISGRAGSAMLRADPAQRWYREAGFHLVQAQTAAVRAAQLTAFRGGLR